MGNQTDTASEYLNNMVKVLHENLEQIPDLDLTAVLSMVNRINRRGDISGLKDLIASAYPELRYVPIDSDIIRQMFDAGDTKPNTSS